MYKSFYKDYLNKEDIYFLFSSLGFVAWKLLNVIDQAEGLSRVEIEEYRDKIENSLSGFANYMTQEVTAGSLAISLEKFKNELNFPTSRQHIMNVCSLRVEMSKHYKAPALGF